MYLTSEDYVGLAIDTYCAYVDAVIDEHGPEMGQLLLRAEELVEEIEHETETAWYRYQV